MSFLPVYLDASAIVKLVVPEPETDALLSVLAHHPDRVSSALARVQVQRALLRAGASRAVRARGEAVLASLVLVQIDDLVLSRAAAFTDAALRSLDAIHLSSALSLGDDPDAFITYDVRLARFAAMQRLHVQHPGVDRLV